jgi:Gpi18-like mannosyltransferase
VADQVLTRTSTAPPRSLARIKSMNHSAALIGATVLMIYGLWIAAFLATGHDARDLIDIGRKFVTQSQSSSVIRYDATYRYAADPTGYDGQFVYYIALDPVHARDYLDWPAYRYGRILEPALAGALAFGNPGLVPFTILLVSWLAIGLSTAVLAAWLKRKRLNPVLALIYAFYAGVVIAFRFDLTEALSFGLVIGAVYLFDFGGRQRVVWSAALFAMAALARETAVLFIIVFAIALLFRDRMEDWRRPLPSALAFLSISLLPLAAWHAFLFLWLQNLGLPPRPVVQPIPFGALIREWPWHVTAIEEIVVVVLPALLVGSLAVRALIRGSTDKYLLLLALQVLLLVVFVDPFAFPDLTASARYTIGIVIAALCAIPTLDRLTRGKRTWLVLCGAAWLVMAPWYLLKPLL